MCYYARMSSTVEQVKDRLSIEEVVSAYVKLQPSGQNLKARCPFHAERTPSFMVSPARQTYHCFGCSVGGDIFSFTEMIEGVDFKGALKILADKAGVEIKYDSANKKDTDQKEILFSIMLAASDFFVKNLAKNTSAKKYLQQRGLPEEIIKEFRVGFAEDSWDSVLLHLTSLGYTPAQIEKAGLIVKSQKNNKYYDRFRSRIMFPISDSAGRVVAFSGRIFGTSAEDEKNAKYINSPETPLYNKSRILYGYDIAKQAIRKNDFAVLVEGQMDLLASHKAGYSNTVAISGTALTHEHIVLISRMSKRLVLALDADEAGLASAAKSAKIALAEGFDVKVVSIPGGMDPADIIKDKGDKGWKKIVRSSKHIVEFLLDLYRKSSNDDRAYKLKVEKDVLPYINLISSAIDREHFIKIVSAYTGSSEEAIASMVDSGAVPSNSVMSTNSAGAASVNLRASSFRERLIAISLWKKNTNLERKIVKLVGEDDYKEVADALTKQDDLFFILEKEYTDDEKLKSDIESFLYQLAEQILQEHLAQVTANIRRAKAEDNEEDLIKFMNESSELHKQLAKQRGA